jgi:hypothetical protein
MNFEGVRRAQVLGQIVPGVPVWRLGPESKYPGLPYVVFPGNAGGPDALASVIRVLRGGGRKHLPCAVPCPVLHSGDRRPWQAGSLDRGTIKGP